MAPHSVAAAKSACATSFTGAPAQMVRLVDGSGLGATSSADRPRPYQLVFSRSLQ
jgi:hypothetical protein